MIKKILVALDGSEHADHALDYALDLADKYSASILLVSVFHPYLYRARPGYLTTDDIQPFLEQQKAYNKKVLSEGHKRVKN